MQNILLLLLLLIIINNNNNTNNDNTNNNIQEQLQQQQKYDTSTRCWILDPIDGTNGLITGNQYIIGLALCLNDGQPVVGVMGNPNNQRYQKQQQQNEQQQQHQDVMIAVKGQGLRYFNNNRISRNTEPTASSCLFWNPSRDFVSKNSSTWHLQQYNFANFVDSSTNGNNNNNSSSSSVDNSFPATQNSSIITSPMATAAIKAVIQTPVAGIDYPPYVISCPIMKTASRTKSSSSAATADITITTTDDGINTDEDWSATKRNTYPPLFIPKPFGSYCTPTKICCGSLIKYFAVASGQVAGFIYYNNNNNQINIDRNPSNISHQSSMDSDTLTLKSWDHASGILCVQESGGNVVIINTTTVEDGNHDSYNNISSSSSSSVLLFRNRNFTVTRGIVCTARETNDQIKSKLIRSLL